MGFNAFYARLYKTCNSHFDSSHVISKAAGAPDGQNPSPGFTEERTKLFQLLWKIGFSLEPPTSVAAAGVEGRYAEIHCPLCLHCALASPAICFLLSCFNTLHYSYISLYFSTCCAAFLFVCSTMQAALQKSSEMLAGDVPFMISDT